MRTHNKVLHWTPRILVILSILFISLFALDSFSAGNTIWQNTVALFMHLIPSIVILGLLIIAWKWEKTGGIIFILFGLAFSIFIFIINYRRTHSIEITLLIVLELCIPFVLAGILFIVSHYNKKRELSCIS